MIVCSRTLYQAMQFFELRDAVFKHHLRLPSEKFSRFGDIGTSVLGLNTRLNEHCRAPDHFRDLAYSIIFSAADVDGFSCANIPGARGKDIRALNIAHVGKIARLRAIWYHGHGFTLLPLCQKSRHDESICPFVGRPRPIDIEVPE